MGVVVLVIIAILAGWLVYLLVPAVMYQACARWMDPESLEAVVKGRPGKFAGIACGVFVAGLSIYKGPR
jgi:hypothetical protein